MVRRGDHYCGVEEKRNTSVLGGPRFLRSLKEEPFIKEEKEELHQRYENFKVPFVTQVAEGNFNTDIFCTDSEGPGLNSDSST